MSISGGCGNVKCSVSTGIDGSLTFGSGELDPNGYWEKPCRKCERAFLNNRVTKPTTTKEQLVAYNLALSNLKDTIRSTKALADSIGIKFDLSLLVDELDSGSDTEKDWDSSDWDNSGCSGF